MYFSFLSVNNSKRNRVKKAFMGRKIFGKDTKRLSIDTKLFLDLTKLNQDNRKLVQFIYKSLIRSQHKSLKQELSRDSFSDYEDNLLNSRENFVKELDKFGSILVDDKPELIKKEKTLPFEQKKIKMDQINELYVQNLEPIQQELMPVWSNVGSDEKQGIFDLYNRWQDSLENNFNRLKLKHKSIQPVFINHRKIIQKGPFNFDINLNHMKKIQLELFDKSGQKDESEKLVSIRPNTRILLKCFKEFMNAFDSIEKARQNMSTNSYWSYLKTSLIHLSKSILRCAFYVHETANLYKAPVGLPPIYVLESDDINDEILIKLESLYHYVFLCINQLNVKVGKNYHEIKEQNVFISTLSKRERKFLFRNNKQKYYKLILKCLIRLIQLCYYMRESIIMKQIRFENEQDLTECDFYSHFISNECNLIKEYLKEIIKNNI